MSTISKTAFIKSCQKIDQKLIKKMPYEIQNVHSKWFPQRFSILGPKVTPKGPPEGLGLTLVV